MPPLICIDARMIQASGIGTYLRGLLDAFQTRSKPSLSLRLLGDPAKLPSGPWSIGEVTASIYSLKEQAEIPWSVHQADAALLHAPHYNMPLLGAPRTIVTVHDLIHLKFPQFWPSIAARAYAQFFFHQVIPRAKRVLTVSENTKRDLIEILSIPADRITVTYPGVSHDRFRTISPESRTTFEKLGLPRDYLLYVGNLKEFKNVERLVEAYRQARQTNHDFPELVLVGRNFIPGFEQHLNEITGVRWLGEVLPELLPCLYKNAISFLFPSLYEGFGLPPLEAMASGTPVLCSNRASLPEAVGDAALLVDPERIEEIVAGINRLVSDSALRKELSVKGLQQAARFSWDKMADQTWQAYEQCLS